MHQLPLVEQAMGRQALALLGQLDAACAAADDLEQAVIESFNQHPGACRTNQRVSMAGWARPPRKNERVGGNFLAANRDQQYLMPPSLSDWLAEDHLAWFLLDVVDGLDLSELYAAYRADGWGRAAHDPSMMLALLLYGYCLGERSSRRIEVRCREDVAFRVITANSFPDHATIARFRARHEHALTGLFVQSLRLCQAAGLVRVGVLALDGTKIGAQASMNATRSRAQIEAEVGRMLAEANSVDAAEDEQYAGRSPRDQSPVLRGGQAARRRRLMDAKARLAAEDQAEQEAYQRKVTERAVKEQATGRRMRGRKPQPPAPDRHRRVNISDPDSRVMPTKSGWVQGYNAQIVTTVDQIIVAAAVTNLTNDQPLLHPMLSATTQILHGGRHRRTDHHRAGRRRLLHRRQSRRRRPQRSRAAHAAVQHAQGP
jgi:transposase